MFLKFLSFLRGYIRLEISGFSVERFISSAIAAGIKFWDVKRDGGKFYACVSRRDFLRAKNQSEKTGTSLKSLDSFGFPKLFTRLSRRWFLLVGAFVFIGGLVFLMSFIWRIDIEGTQRLNQAEILDFLSENNIAIGSFRHGLSYRSIENKLLLEFADIAWASVSLRGTRLLVIVSETIENAQSTIHNDEIQDIVAAKDGVIFYMATSSGQPLFRPGDVVAAGEVIVAGRLTQGSAEEGNLSYRYVRAESEVWARVYYKMEIEVPFAYYEMIFTGQSRRSYSFSIGSWAFELPFNFGADDDFVFFETTESRWQASFGENYPLPLGRTRTNTYELSRRLRTRTSEVAMYIALELANRRIAEELEADASILDRQISFAENEQSLLLEVFLITIERIDVVQSIENIDQLPEIID